MKAKLMNCVKPLTQTNCVSWALLLLRFVAGLAFIFHGWGKIQTPFGWMPEGAPVPGFLQGLAALAEFGGGIAWLLGLLTPLASLGLAITMAVATAMHMFVMKDPFVNMTGGSSYELAAVYFSIAILFMAVGPGKFSADYKIFGQR
ncbi:MAG: DoxX family protein [Pseudobdellovibrionaceae bacterium]